MNNIQLLKLIVQMAIANGWKQHISNFHFTAGYVQTRVYYKTIFDPDFAKAFFGRGSEEHIKDLYLEETCIDYKIDEEAEEEKIKIPAWKYHMARYVSMEKPLEYFARHV